MKRLISFLLILVMIVMLVGCNSGASDQTTTTTTTADCGSSNEPQKTELSRGKMEGDVYKNDYLGFQFKKPATWIYYTDEEIAQLLNFTVDSILNENFKETLENNPLIYDMMVVDLLTNTNIGVSYENLSKSFASNITEEQYILALKQQIANLPSMTAVFSDEIEKVKLGNTDFTRITCETTAYGVTMTQVYYLNKTDNYMCSVIVTLSGGYTIEEIEAMFK